jgi:hypothetical protein
MCSSEIRKPVPFVVNLRQEMPLGRKLALLRRNVWIKVSTRSTCCGHPGEPGC